MGIFTKFVAKLKGESTASEADWQELEAELLAADLGPTLTAKVLESAKKIKGDDAEASLREILKSNLSLKSREISSDLGTKIVLVVGVNGTISVAWPCTWQAISPDITRAIASPSTVDTTRSRKDRR